MFKIGIFVVCKGGKSKLVKWLPARYPTGGQADAATEQKNKELGADLDNLSPGHKYAMWDNA